VYVTVDVDCVKTECHSVVDKYTEYDNVLICLDALLHKSQAYRHLLFNVQILVSVSTCLSLCLSVYVFVWLLPGQGSLGPDTFHDQMTKNVSKPCSTLCLKKRPNFETV